MPFFSHHHNCSIVCKYHPPATQDIQSEQTPKPQPLSLQTLEDDRQPSRGPSPSQRPAVPPELHDSVSRTIAYALDFMLDTLDYSPDETSLPKDEETLTNQLTADPLKRDLYSVIVWNDDKHSFDEVI